MAIRKVSDTVSQRVFRIVGRRRSGRFSAFTLAELIVAVTILAVLASVGFVVLSGYLSDARESASKANVRSVYSAISSESALTGNSPRYYVVHDPAYALSGSAYVVFGTNSEMLVAGDWNAPGTNYSAGNPNWTALKMDPDKFKISMARSAPIDRAFAMTDPKRAIIWAADVMDSTGKGRMRSFVQAAGVFSDKTAFVVGNYPTALSGSVSGLVKDATNSSSTWALVDGAATWAAPGCSAQTFNGYSVPELSSGQEATVPKSVSNGSVSWSFSCYFGTLSLVSETPVCVSGYVPAWLSCVADVCGSTVPANATSTATSQSVSGTWHYSSSPGQCTFDCASGYSWDGWSCKASCLVPAAESYSGQTYAISPNGALLHGTSSVSSATAAFGISPANGSLSATFSYSCSDGSLSKAVTPWTAACQANYAWNSSWTAPVCSANTQTFTCSAKPSTGTSWNSVSSYVQTWNGSAWIPVSSVTAYNATASTSECRYKCATGYSWNGSSCVANSWSSGSWWTCSGETGTWSYSSWWACSVTCWGGTQTRTASCTRNGNGSQSRTVQCLRYDGTVLADANCLSVKPSTSQSCTQGTDAVCWTATTSQSCNTQSCPVNWACSSTAWSCTAGSSTGDNGATACGTARTWTCSGLNGGTNASCSVSNPACVTITATSSCYVPANGVYKISNSSSSYINSWGGASLIYATTVKVQSGWANWCARVLSTGATNYWYVGWSLLWAWTVTTSSHTFSSLGAVYWDDYWWRQNLTWVQVQ